MTDKKTKRYIKRCRQRSNAHHDYILRRANYQCEICEWGNRNLNCLHVHHIMPLKTLYGGQITSEMIEDNSFVDMEFEHANLVALCPNCHRLVHTFMNSKGFGHRVQILKEIEKYYRYSSYSVHLFLKIAMASLFYKRYLAVLADQIKKYEKEDEKVQSIIETELPNEKEI